MTAGTAKEVGVTDGVRQVAERCVQALEASEVCSPIYWDKAAGCVLIALGSSPAEDEALARQLAASFRSDVVAAMEAAVNRALAQLGGGPS
jgi:hypothetical protein